MIVTEEQLAAARQSHVRLEGAYQVAELVNRAQNVLATQRQVEADYLADRNAEEEAQNLVKESLAAIAAREGEILAHVLAGAAAAKEGIATLRAQLKEAEAKSEVDAKARGVEAEALLKTMEEEAQAAILNEQVEKDGAPGIMVARYTNQNMRNAAFTAWKKENAAYLALKDEAKALKKGGTFTPPADLVARLAELEAAPTEPKTAAERNALLARHAAGDPELDGLKAQLAGRQHAAAEAQVKANGSRVAYNALVREHSLTQALVYLTASRIFALGGLTLQPPTAPAQAAGQ